MKYNLLISLKNIKTRLIEFTNDFNIYFKNDIKVLRKKKIIQINQPLIIITQIQRSGGTFLSQLFDGHPECYSYPHELMWGRPRKWNWPDLKNVIHNPSKAWSYLRYNDIAYIRKYCIQGYSKYAKVKEITTYPFVFSLSLQKKIFKKLAESERRISQRKYLDIFMTSFYNSWIDYQNFYGSEKKYITGFTPRINMTFGSVEKFFKDYPDGFIITMIRHPGNWYASAKKHTKQYEDIDNALNLWHTSAKSSVELTRKYKKKVILILFEDLVSNRQQIMESICNRINIKWNDCLNKSTFNSISIFSDSSFECKKGTDLSVLTRYKSLSEFESEKVEKYIEYYNNIQTDADILR